MLEPQENERRNELLDTAERALVTMELSECSTERAMAALHLTPPGRDPSWLGCGTIPVNCHRETGLRRMRIVEEKNVARSTSDLIDEVGFRQNELNNAHRLIPRDETCTGRLS